MTTPALTTADLATALSVVGLSFGDDALEQLVEVVDRQRGSLQRLRDVPLANDVPPAFGFNPLPADPPAVPAAPATGDAIADLAARIAAKEVSCREVAEQYLQRLHEVDAVLHCVVTFLDDRAMAQARALDDDPDRRGPLRGIPWGAKDLLALAGHPTTWGAAPFRNQVIESDAAVVRTLDAAGAVCLAKLSLGELAYGDTWFGGQTRNPWDPEKGSSGSSAGSAAAVVAGAVPFALGSETLGSLVSPSVVCGASTMRPTFGTVDTTGAMSLSWTMDKLGPMARSLRDCAVVLEALVGRPFGVELADLRGVRIGVDEGAFEALADTATVLDELRDLGAELVPFAVPTEPPAADLLPILFVEAAAAFDDLVRSGGIDTLAREGSDSWRVIMRAARLVPAVEYVNANRARTLLARAMSAAFDDAGVDVYVHPSWGGQSLVVTNLTGEPTAAAPCPHPQSVSFTGRVGGDAYTLAIASLWQEATGHHLREPTVTAT